MSVNSKMTALANEIRELSGTTAKIGLDDMTTHVANANTEIDDQINLISQIATALEGKAAEGGDSGSGGGAKVKIGTIVVASDVSSGTVATVSDVGFQPTYVAIYAGGYKVRAGSTTSAWNYLMYTVNNSGKGRMGSVQKAATSSTVPPRLVYAIDEGSSITFTENGFTWTYNNSTVLANTYEYIAIG